jgi:hypothetical protein
LIEDLQGEVVQKSQQIGRTVDALNRDRLHSLLARTRLGRRTSDAVLRVCTCIYFMARVRRRQIRDAGFEIRKRSMKII